MATATRWHVLTGGDPPICVASKRAKCGVKHAESLENQIVTFTSFKWMRQFVDPVKHGLWRHAIAGWVGLALALAATGAVAEPVRMGVLAFEGKDAAQARWQETATYLSQQLAPRVFEVVPLTYEEINAEVQQKRLDLVLTNPEHFVALQRAFALRPLVTQATSIGGKPYDVFASTLFTLQSSSIKELDHIRGKRVSAVGLYSLGGFLSGAHVLLKNGIDVRGRDVASLAFTGIPHQRVVQEVLQGRADVGMVRAGVLESMAAKGELNLADLRVLNANAGATFPYAHSTPLVPEWPVAAVAHLSGFLAKDITLALLALKPEDEAAQKARIHGFLPPADYTPVESLMRELKVFPKVDQSTAWRDLWLEYEELIEAGLLVIALSVATVAAFLWRQNRRLRDMGQLVEEAQQHLELTATAFNSHVGLIVTDAQTHILRANAAICELLGRTEAELLGQSTLVLRSGDAPEGFIRRLWLQLGATGQWKGEIPCTHVQGHSVPCLVTIKATAIGGQQRGFVASFADLTQQKKTEDEISRLAYYDTLTGIPNRRLFLQELERQLDAVTPSGTLGALLFIDLDHFKVLNDTHGHVFGDQLLQQIAQRLQGALTQPGLLARLGGDEFVVMLTGLPVQEDKALEQAMALADRMHHLMLRPYRLHVALAPGASKELAYHCSGSIGVSLFGTQPEPVVEVMKRADVAMYQAKQAGRNAVRAYEASVQMSLRRKGILSADLSDALMRGELSVHYQLQTDAHGQPVGAECLLRWSHPVHGQVSPMEFIPLAEESGAIIDMGDWILAMACRTLADWSQKPAFSGLSLSINVSPRQMIEAHFVERIQHWLDETGAPANLLLLEITEGIVLHNADKVIDQMHRLCQLGIGFSVDDFGTGYSSMSYLQRLPLKQVKIDKAFVRDVTYNPSSEAIVRAILALSHAMQLKVVSEGVETLEQRKLLVALGCDQLQGYLLGRPVERVVFEQQFMAHSASHVQ